MGTINNPFAPGPSTKPPHVAGREEQQDLIRKALQLIAEPPAEGKLEHSPPRPIKIIGPRGAGKTTLLNLAGAEAQRQGIHVIKNIPQPAEDPSALIINGLKKGMDWRERFPLALSRLSKIGGGFGPASASAERDQQKQTLVEVMKARLHRHPVLLLLDEAMHYDVAFFSTLLQACQMMIGEQHPLAVIMAGTPALDGRLKQVNATFINRCRSIYIHQISDEAVRDALRKPLLDNGVKVADEALDLMASWTDNYPYFVQLAGEAVWEAMQDAGRNDIDLALAQGAEAAMQKERRIYYHSVYEKIADADADALAYASQVVAIVEGAASPFTSEKVVDKLAAANNGMSSQEARKIFNLLLDNSLIWFADEGKVRAAIPSFFQYFKARQEENKD